MPTFPRGFANHCVHVHNAKVLEKIARETGGDVAEERKVLHAPTPADSLALRGIPAIGRSVAGVITGTQPEQRCVVRLSAYDRLRLRLTLG